MLMASFISKQRKEEEEEEEEGVEEEEGGLRSGNCERSSPVN